MQQKLFNLSFLLLIIFNFLRDNCLIKIILFLTTTNSNNSDSDNSPDFGYIDEQEFEVEKIVNHKIFKGKLFFQVRWKGYTPDDDTWETLDNLTSCDESINNYLSQQSNQIKQQIKAKREKTKVQTVQYGSINEKNEIIYHVVTNEGTEKDLTSSEMRMNHPFELLRFLEKTSFKST